VNLEVDVVAKYVERLLGERAASHVSTSAGLGWPTTPAIKERP
jgi:hypothetical protein